MVTYIKKDFRGFYLEMDEELDPNLFNNLGTTYEDFLNNKWTLLSTELVQFHKDNPNASIKEVLDMQLQVIEEVAETLDLVKARKIAEISRYDRSSSVNSFTINGVLKAWFTPSERSNYSSSINSAKILNQENLTFCILDNMFTVSVYAAERMLAAVQLYADSCYLVTAQHYINVKKLNSIEEVESYDFKSGYPEQLNFTIE